MSENIITAIISFDGGIFVAVFGLIGTWINANALVKAARIEKEIEKGKAPPTETPYGKIALIIAGAVVLLAIGLLVMAFSGRFLVQQISNPPSPLTQPTLSPTNSLTSALVTPTSPEEATALFGGPVELWKSCPKEPAGCWTFAAPGKSYSISVPNVCLNSTKSIDGWRNGGGYPGEPDSIQGDFYIWESLEGATIRCY